MYRKFPNLCSPLRIGDLVLRNRIESAPMAHPNITEDGLITPESIAFYELRAKGGAGVVTVSEAITHISTGKSHDRNINLEADYMIMGLTELAGAIKRHGAAAGIELSHGGYRAGADNAEKYAAIDDIRYSASAMTLPDGKKVTEMPKEIIREIVQSFEKGAALCKKAGFDMIMLHGGHGWLINQFLSPYSNKRTDEYGGPVENRARLALEILDSIRAAVGPHYPIEFRISAEEYLDGGYMLDEGIKIAKLVESRIDLLHVSTGNLISPKSRRTHPTMFDERGCNVFYSEEMKKHIRIPIVAIGALSDPGMMEKIIAEGKADMVAAARALLADPYLPRKAMAGLDEDITPCVRCNTCFAERFRVKTRICAVNPVIGSEIESRNTSRAASPKKVLVAGGGPAGMQAAITAAKQGHYAVLCEKTGELGGALKGEKHIPFKTDLHALIKSKELELKKAGAEIRLNTAVTRKYAENEAPDTLIVAIGAEPIIPAMEGIERANVIIAENAAAQTELIGKKVAIIGGGLVGCELGIHLANIGRNVTIIEMTDMIASNSNASLQRVVANELREQKLITIKLSAKALRIEDKGLLYIDNGGNEGFVEADTIINAVGRRSLYEQAEELLDSAPIVELVGDCIKPQSIREAIYRGHHAALDI